MTILLALWGFIQKAVAWLINNPVWALVIALAVLAGWQHLRLNHDGKVITKDTAALVQYKKDLTSAVTANASNLATISQLKAANAQFAETLEEQKADAANAEAEIIDEKNQTIAAMLAARNIHGTHKSSVDANCNVIPDVAQRLRDLDAARSSH